MAMREAMTGMWGGLDRGLKMAFAGAVVLVLAAIVWGSYVVLHDDYRTLFSQLADGDAAAIVDALKRQKVPYKLSDGGATISVPAERVHETRLGLMSSNVALSGGVGFEIFDKQGLGATEQSQRVSYQRALQGELARTIATLENVKQARVHLVLPESSLFKRDKQEATAAVTLTMKPGNTLDRQQIIGVQRLVGASVAGLDPTRVIITDQRGVTLSAADPATGSVSGVEARLDLQRQVEAHIAQKIAGMLDSAYGSGQAIISVAVALSFDATKTTTQDLLPVKNAGNSQDVGLVRKRHTVTGGATEVPSDTTEGSGGGRRAGSTLEVEYEYGRRVEEVIAAPGAVKRITVGVIVPPRIGEDQQRRIKEFVQVAAGIDESRGDIVSIQSLTSEHSGIQDGPATGDAETTSEPPLSSSPDASTPSQPWTVSTLSPVGVLGILVAILLVGGLLVVALRNSRRSLSAQDREQLLQEIRRAMGDDGRVSTLKAKS